MKPSVPTNEGLNQHAMAGKCNIYSNLFGLQIIHLYFVISGLTGLIYVIDHNSFFLFFNVSYS